MMGTELLSCGLLESLPARGGEKVPRLSTKVAWFAEKWPETLISITEKIGQALCQTIWQAIWQYVSSIPSFYTFWLQFCLGTHLIKIPASQYFIPLPLFQLQSACSQHLPCSNLLPSSLATDFGYRHRAGNARRRLEQPSRGRRSAAVAQRKWLR